MASIPPLRLEQGADLADMLGGIGGQALGQAGLQQRQLIQATLASQAIDLRPSLSAETCRPPIYYNSWAEYNRSLGPAGIKCKGIREELQQEVDDWLDDI